MIDPIRDLLIRLASHMAYMQGQLEALHELDDPEDYYWYRESVLLRQKVTDALADEPAVREGREPVSVTTQPVMPTDEELREMFNENNWNYISPETFEDIARAVLARWGNPAPQPVPVSERLQQMEDLAADAVAGLRYIEQSHGRLYGVGWDRVYKKADRLKPAHALPVPGQEVEG